MPTWDYDTAMKAITKGIDVREGYCDNGNSLLSGIDMVWPGLYPITRTLFLRVRRLMGYHGPTNHIVMLSIEEHEGNPPTLIGPSPNDSRDPEWWVEDCYDGGHVYDDEGILSLIHMLAKIHNTMVGPKESYVTIKRGE